MKVFYKENEVKKINMKQKRSTYIKWASISLSCFVLLFAIVMLTFALFESKSDYTLIHGVIGQDGDITVSYIIEGVSSSTPPAKGTGYKAKSVNCTNGDGSWLRDEWGVKVVNLTGKAKCNVEFEVSTDVTVDLYSAAEDELYYYDGSERVSIGTTDSTGKLTAAVPVDQSITIYSTVANNPDDLTNYYSKTVETDEDTTELYIMPEHTIYWYGWRWRADEWTKDEGGDAVATFETNYLYSTITSSGSTKSYFYAPKPYIAESINFNILYETSKTATKKDSYSDFLTIGSEFEFFVRCGRNSQAAGLQPWCYINYDSVNTHRKTLFYNDGSTWMKIYALYTD